LIDTNRERVLSIPRERQSLLLIARARDSETKRLRQPDRQTEGPGVNARSLAPLASRPAATAAGRERERGRERQRETERESERGTMRDRGRETDIYIGRENKRERESAK